MSVIQRREKIREMLATRPFLSFEELMREFPKLSSMTLRRDIEYFEKRGEAIKVRGGARSMKFITTSMEDAFSKRLGDDMLQKEAIAQAALEYIETGRSVFIDSGTTMLTLARHLPDERINIITTGPNIALELIKKQRPVVSIIGGMINRDNISIVGDNALEYVDTVNVDTAFIVPSGISKDGVTCGNYTECELKRKIIEKARQVILLITQSKIDKILPYSVCDISAADVIITGVELSAEMISKCLANKVKIIKA